MDWATGVHATSVFKPLSASSEENNGERKEEGAERRSSNEAPGINRTHHEEGDGTSPKASPSKPSRAAFRGAHAHDDKAVDEEARTPRSFTKPGWNESNETPADNRKRQREEDGRTQNCISLGHSMPASALAVDAQKSKTSLDDENKALVSGRQGLATGDASQNQQKQQRTKGSHSTQSVASTQGSDSSSKRNGNSQTSFPKATKKKNAFVTSIEPDDKDAADKCLEKPVAGGWLNILRGAFSATGTPPRDEGEETGCHLGSGMNGQRPVSSRSPAKSDVRVKRKPQVSRQAHGQQHSGSQPSSYVQPHNAPLNVYTRNLESGEPLDVEDDHVQVEEVGGLKGWCTWFNVWLAVGVSAMVVALPVALIVVPHKGHIYPYGKPDESDGRSNPRTLATSHKLQAPAIPLETAYNENELEGTPKCVFPTRVIVEDIKAVTRRLANHTKTGSRYRPIICVVDATYIYVRQSSLGFGYDVKAVPFHYCTALVYYAAMFVEDGSAMLKVQQPFGATALRDLHRAAYAKRRHQTIEVYLTIGGSREDSFGIADVITQENKWAMLNEFLKTYRANGFEGVNLDWNRPGDECSHHIGQGQVSGSLKNFISFLKGRKRLRVMLTVPPLLKLIELYNISAFLPRLDYVVVATHKLRRPGVVACSGERVLAAAAFRKIREHFLKPDDAENTLRKFAYSISAGADIYKLANGTQVKYLAPIKRISTVFNRRVIMPGKTSYEDVCYLAPEDRDSLKECSVVMGSRTVSRNDGIEQEVAAIAGPEELKMRLRSSYEDGMGDTAVAVFDVILDDSFRHCSETGSDAPLLQAIAETGPF